MAKGSLILIGRNSTWNLNNCHEILFLIIVCYLSVATSWSQEFNVDAGARYSEVSGFEVFNPKVKIDNYYFNPYLGISFSNLAKKNKTGLGAGITLSSRRFDFAYESPIPFQ